MIVSRFAPSPTGRLHLGHAYSAILGHFAARQAGGQFLLRIEDLDATRSRPEFVAGIQEDLRWLGLQWDHPVLVQSQRADVYASALNKLRELGLAYPCFCTRSDIAAALAAPHRPGAAYPGTCRGLPHDPQLRAAQPHSWRLDSARGLTLAGLPSWTERDGRRFQSMPAEINDEILARKDAPAAYHLACVVDDAASGVTLVVRGVDLRPSTPIQRLLQMLLSLPEPAYLHHELVTHEDGRRLAKRDLAPTLAALRESGADGRALAQDLATGLVPSGFRLEAP
jgi:glutamyl-Q tRNA(Asp) synthetase